MFDAIIVGGSYAGLSAALQLARARRTVLVIDAGSRRNRFANSPMAFSARTAGAPAAIAADGRPSCWPIPTLHGTMATPKPPKRPARLFRGHC